jgi:hypothetical protein
VESLLNFRGGFSKGAPLLELFGSMDGYNIRRVSSSSDLNFVYVDSDLDDSLQTTTSRDSRFHDGDTEDTPGDETDESVKGDGTAVSAAAPATRNATNRVDAAVRRQIDRALEDWGGALQFGIAERPRTRDNQAIIRHAVER